MRGVAVRWMLDTNTVSHALKGTIPAVRAHMARVPPAAICISAVTKSELVHGVSRNPAAIRIGNTVSAFLRWVDVADWNSDIAEVHGVLRAELQAQGLGMGAYDLMIAAHALALDLTLVTNDRAFSAISGLRLENWALDG